MKLIQIGCKAWRVLLVCDDRGTCQVLEYLMQNGSSVNAVKRMLNRLRDKIPERGPEYGNSEKAKHLSDGIYELREQPKKGPKPRVFFFQDGQDVVVCTEAFDKRSDNLDSFISRAKTHRDRYLSDKERNRIDIEVLPYK